jgi:hypothetical protein
VVTIDEVRAFAITLPRSSEALAEVDVAELTAVAAVPPGAARSKRSGDFSTSRRQSSSALPRPTWSSYLVLVCGQERDVAITAPGVLAAMRVRISDAVLMGDLTDFLEAAECRVRKVGEATLDVTMPRAPSADQAQREIDIYLKTWQAMHPGSYARIVSEGRADRTT